MVKAIVRNRRLTMDDRKQQILNAGLLVAMKKGYASILRTEVAHRAKCTPPLINVYFKTMDDFRAALMDEAIKQNNLVIIAQGLAIKDKRCMRLPDAVKAAAIKQI